MCVCVRARTSTHIYMSTCLPDIVTCNSIPSNQHKCHEAGGCAARGREHQGSHQSEGFYAEEKFLPSSAWEQPHISAHL